MNISYRLAITAVAVCAALLLAAVSGQAQLPKDPEERAKVIAVTDPNGAVNELRRFQNDGNLKAAPVAPLALLQLATYLREEVYYHPEKLVMEQKARRIIHGLFDAFAGEPRLLPRPVQERLDGTDRYRVVCDFVSGLTDRSALDLYNRLFETYEFGFGGGTTP